jgi:hypothetical protein
MKKFLLTLLCLGACLYSAPALTSAHASNLDFKFENECDQTIEHIYISPQSSDSWEEDVLGDDVLRPGHATNIHFSPRETHRYWDIKVVTKDGEDHTFQNGYDLTRITRVRLIDDGDGSGSCSLQYWYR